ncbi:hypothetical protein J6590_044566 [Homalodisca vitripennis]|nr:hypothetical protein J6590_044566 [Homalodisca vitripennis]
MLRFGPLVFVEHRYAETRTDNCHTLFGDTLSVVSGKILGSRHRHANDTNLHEKTWPRTTNLHEKVSLAVLKLSRRSMKTDCENQ